mgnify:CR=1 FL=1
MATFQQHIEGLTQITLTSESSPSIAELTEILKEGLVHTVNIITTINQEELPGFTSTSSSTTSVAKEGKILSVTREHDSESILRPCIPMNASLRTEALDSDSLYFKSKFNPGFYELDGKIHCVPSAGGSFNSLVVTQISYDFTVAATTNYNSGEISNFPTRYEYLLGIYGAAIICNAKANDIHNNMPTVPSVPLSPDFSKEIVGLPELPVFNIETPSFSLGRALSSINAEDLEKADKFLSIFDKQVETYTKRFEEEDSNFQKDFELYKAELENLVKNADRKTQVESSEFTGEMEKYKTEIEFFQVDLQEAAAQYKWYTSQYVTFINQYNTALGIKAPKPKQEQGE